MTTSQTTLLFNPTGSEKIPLWTIGYFRSRNKSRVYELVIEEFKKSGLTKADLARRMGKTPDQISRWLGAPGNWTLDTISDFLFAISGAEPEYSVQYPLSASARNYKSPAWLEEIIARQEEESGGRMAADTRQPFVQKGGGALSAVIGDSQ